MGAAPNLEVDLRNEQVVLGVILVDVEARARVLPGLVSEKFTREDHRVIISALRKIAEVGASYTAETLVQVAAGAVDARYLATLEQEFGAIPAANISLHLEALDRAAAKRAVQEDFVELYGALDDGEAPLEDAERAASRLLAGLRSATTSKGVVRDGDRVWRRWMERLAEDRRQLAEGHQVFHPLHFTGLDQWIFEGARPGRLGVLAARPNMGKSTLANNFALRQAAHKRRCLNCQVEAGTDSAVEQMACALTRIEVEKVIKRPDELSEEEMLRLELASKRILGNGYLFFDDQVRSLDDLERVVVETKAEVVVLDLFEYLVPVDAGETNGARMITDALRRLKLMAERLKFFALVVNQIKRIKRERDKRPRLDELKNSGGYEEVADLVLLLHRERYYKVHLPDDLLEVILAKQRRGPANLSVAFEFEPEFGRVGNHRPEADVVPTEVRDVE